MDISIALCTFNGARFLETQLRSIGRQTKIPFELVICDDGSSDATPAIVERFAATASFPVSFHRQPKTLGSTKNFEQALQRCRGEAIALCDQDDLWAPEKLARLVTVLETEPAVAGVFSNARLIDSEDRELPGDLWHRVGFSSSRQRLFSQDASAVLIHSDVVTGATFLFRSKWVPRLLPIPAEWVHDGWIALLLATLAQLRALPACPMSYRIHAAQQVGAPEVSWHQHLATEAGKARDAHLRHASRLRLMKAKLEELRAFTPDVRSPVLARTLQELQRKTRFVEGRAKLLHQPRLRRFSAFGMLPSYLRYEKGVLSLLRDISHQVGSV